ncbi:alkylated DNA repair protein [Actinomycetes bacterium]|nr:alkylated DNA repair protein [Actinomycetes bacterium]
MYAIKSQLLPFDGTATLYENFLDSQFATQAFNQIRDESDWEQPEITIFGNTVLEPRLSTWHNELGQGYKYSGVMRRAQPFSKMLGEIRDRCVEVTDTRFNSALVNFYRNGQDGMGWHSDDEACNGPEPTIASVSLGATRRFDMRHRKTGETIKIQLESGSLLVMAGKSQQFWVHQIAKTKRVQEPRINLTFRRVIENFEN